MNESSSRDAERLIPVTSLQEFFRDSIDAALQANQVRVDHHTAHYVVNLLTVFARSEEFYEATDDGPALRPLALMLADVVDAPSDEERNAGLRRVGDVSLFLAGFFAEGVRQSAVGLGYYVNMGGGAYQSLSAAVGRSVRGRVLGRIFAELGEKFADMVDVLNEVRDSARTRSDADALRLYELWVQTGSRRASRLLRSAGVIPIETARRTH